MNSNDISLGNVIEDFPIYNESFGLLNDMDNSLIIKDVINYNISYNQARIEDITFMEYDNVPSTLKNYLENDLEPLNLELIQELLGSVDNQTDLEVLLQKPFNEESILMDTKESNLYLSGQNCAIGIDVVNIDKENETLNENIIIESAYIQSVREDDRLDNNFVERDINLEHKDTVKSSRAIEEVELCNIKDIVDIIDLQYPIKKKSRMSDFVLAEIVFEPRRLKRKAPNRPLLVDNVTTISHQVIRENMTKNKFCLVDKNSLFPNALISRSLKAQVACSASNLFDFPGNIEILRSHQLLSLWMKRKHICQKVKNNLFEFKNKSLPKSNVDIVVISGPILETSAEMVNEISDLSIEQLRGRISSKRTTMLIDSFTMGSDSLQKSIHQNSFDGDKTLDDVNKQIFDEPVINQVDVSMLPIIEEDINQRQDDMTEVIVTHRDIKMVDKSGVWRTIKEKFNEKLDDHFSEDQVRVSFYELCPKGSLKKNAAVFFITLLRLAKYRKIRIFQDKVDSEIFIALPKIKPS